MRLEVEPRLDIDSEKPGQAQRGIGADAALAMYDFVDTAGRHADFYGKPCAFQW
jgi:hypothetical protein